MAPPNCVEIVGRYQVAPAFDSPDIANQSVTLPLTFYDIIMLKVQPAESLWFYNIDSSPEFFNTIILPKLKQLLSYTLLHFLPLAGHLAWSSNSHKPIVLYSPNDTVSLTVALSNADFDRLSSNGIREAIESRPYVPELSNSDTKASVIALQITLFPSKGFRIGGTSHHAVIDGKSTTMFIKAWAHKCKSIEKESPVPPLPAQLTPFFDREVIEDSARLEMLFLNQWLGPNKLDSETDFRSLKIPQEMGDTQDLVRSTFELTREDIKLVRQNVLSQLNVEEPINAAENTIHLSTFVLTCAYIMVCLVKARGGEINNNHVGISCSLLEPPVCLY